MNTARKIAGGQQEPRPEIISFNSLLPKDMRCRAEVKTMLSMIDREISISKSVAELDFRAGYLFGRIDEKQSAGFITAEDAEQLKNVLHAKYEIFRRLGT